MENSCILSNLTQEVEMSDSFSDFDIEPYMDDNQGVEQEVARELEAMSWIRRWKLPWPRLPRKEYRDRCRLPFCHELEARRMKQYAVFVEVLKFSIKTRFKHINIPDGQVARLTNIVVRELYRLFINVDALALDSCGVGLSTGDRQAYQFEAYESCVEKMNTSITILCGRLLSRDVQKSIDYTWLLKDVHDFVVEVVVLFDENPIGKGET